MVKRRGKGAGHRRAGEFPAPERFEIPSHRVAMGEADGVTQRGFGRVPSAKDSAAKFGTAVDMAGIVGRTVLAMRKNFAAVRPDTLPRWRAGDP